jgi:hypothetical protein
MAFVGGGRAVSGVGWRDDDGGAVSDWVKRLSRTLMWADDVCDVIAAVRC